MGGRTLKAVISLSLFVSSVGWTNAASLSSLKDKRKRVAEALELIEEGRSPCYSKLCQSKKAQLLEEITKKLQTIPVSLKLQGSGIETAHYLVHKRFQIPSEESVEPNTLDEWAMWWDRRFSYEQELRSNWQRFVGEVYLQEKSLSSYRRLLKQPETDRLALELAWQNGLAEAAKQLRLSSTLMDQAARVQDELTQNQLKKQAQAALDSINEIEAKLGLSIREICTKLLPSLSFSDAVGFLIHIERWMNRTYSDSPFEPYLSERLLKYREEIKKVTELIDEFNALEYGVVGLNNFGTMINEAVRMDAELEIQTRLDKVDSLARLGIHIGAFYLSLGLSKIAFGSISLLEYGVPGFAIYYAEEKNFDPSEAFIPRSKRSQELMRRLPAVEDKLQTRLQSLKRLQAQLEIALNKLDTQIVEQERGNSL